MSTPVTTFTPGKSDWRPKFGELFAFRYLWFNLVVRNLKVRYRRSLLGVFWSLLNPLLTMLIFTLVFTVLMPNNNIRNYAVFILVGLLPWNFFRGSVTGGTVSISGSRALIRKVSFPKEVLPAAAVTSDLVNFLLAGLLLIVFLYATGLGLTIHALWVPAILLTQILFILGLAFVFSTLNVFYKDIMMILDVVMLAWFFLTPIFYPFDLLDHQTVALGIELNPAQVMRWVNPMASIVDGYRTVLWGSMNSDGAVAMEPLFLLRTFVTSLLIFIFGYLLLARYQHLFAEKL